MTLAEVSSTELGPIGGEGLGPFGNVGSKGGVEVVRSLLNGISSLIGFLTIVASIWMLFQLFFAGYQWITAGGEAKKLQDARDRIVHAFIGMLIVVAAWSLVALAGQFFGFNTLVNPTEFIQNITITGQ
jgi:ATP-dependent protease HslVU (ClpYQ) peptidase subunit